MCPWFEPRSRSQIYKAAERDFSGFDFSYELRIENPRVASSILAPATSILKAHRDVGFFTFSAMLRLLQTDLVFNLLNLSIPLKRFD